MSLIDQINGTVHLGQWHKMRWTVWQTHLVQAWIGFHFSSQVTQTTRVSSFDGQERSKGIPIATCATMVTPESGSHCILILPQMLWFGKQLSQSLINLNQLHVHGTLVKNDPTVDGDNEYGLINNNMFIPLYQLMIKWSSWGMRLLVQSIGIQQ